MSRRPLRELAVGVRAIGLWVELLGTAATGGNATPRSWVIMRGSIAMATLLVAGRIDRPAQHPTPILKPRLHIMAGRQRIGAQLARDAQ